MKAAITGHQNLGSADTVRWVVGALEKVLNAVDISLGYSCLAIGADQLFAEILLKKEVPFVAVCACSKIEKTFVTENDKKAFNELLAKAFDIITLEFIEPSEEAYFSAGKLIVDETDILIAIWNGQVARGLGGTGDVVLYAQNKAKKIIHINPITQSITDINV